MNNVSVNGITPYKKNAKKHPKKQVQQVADSIKEFGFNQPIVVDKNNVIIVGHGRFEAAKLLGLEEVPVLQADLTEEQANAYRLADNKLNESDWDMELVIEELKGLEPAMIDLTGFDLTGITLDGYDTEFSLPDGDKQPFQQITFTLADRQVEIIKEAIAEIKKSEEFTHCETYGNENSNGNALFTLVLLWEGQRT